MIVKVGTHEATSPRKSLHKGTGHRDFSHEQFTQNILRNKLSSDWFEFVGLVAGTKVQLFFGAKMANSHDGTMRFITATCYRD